MIYFRTGTTAAPNAGLPELPESSVITDAYFSLWQYDATYSLNHATAYVHTVTSAWTPETLTWYEYEDGAGAYDANYMDALSLQKNPTYNEDGYKGYHFVITPAVRSWYENSAANHGICLRLKAESATGNF